MVEAIGEMKRVMAKVKTGGRNPVPPTGVG